MKCVLGEFFSITFKLLESSYQRAPSVNHTICASCMCNSRKQSMTLTPISHQQSMVNTKEPHLSEVGIFCPVKEETKLIKKKSYLLLYWAT